MNINCLNLFELDLELGTDFENTGTFDCILFRMHT
jgi:hypothetical protein